MPDILTTIAKSRQKRCEEQKKKVPLEELKQQEIPAHPSFYEALSRDGLSYICEIKKASPSKGLIAETVDPAGLAYEYEQARASAISCLTEPDFFLGSDENLKLAVNACSLPVLRKDFVTDVYMIYEAAVLGASAVLLIVSLLEPEQLKEYLQTAHHLGLDALVECHDASEIKTALEAGARIIGVNNRNLRDFSVNPSNSLSLIEETAGKGIVFVSESGISKPEEIKQLKEAGASAVLIGETMMKAEDKAQKLAWLDGRAGC